jgi:hypothetical protein
MNPKSTKYKTAFMREATHDRLKRYCKKKGLRIGEVVEAAITEYLNRRRAKK